MTTTPPHEHIVKSYDEEQRRISDEVVRMGQLAVSQLEAALEAIVGAARTGRIGDGKIFVSEITDVLRIRTGETGAAAV